VTTGCWSVSVSLFNFRVIFSPFPEFYLIVTSFDFARFRLNWMKSVVIYGKRSTVPLYHEFTNLREASDCVNKLQFWLSTVCLQFLLDLHFVFRLLCNGAFSETQFLAFGLNFTSECYGELWLNHLKPNVNYSGRTAPLTSKVAFYIFIQQI